jgi:hypothetical protein
MQKPILKSGLKFRLHNTFVATYATLERTIRGVPTLSLPPPVTNQTPCPAPGLRVLTRCSSSHLNRSIAVEYRTCDPSITAAEDVVDSCQRHSNRLNRST